MRAILTYHSIDDSGSPISVNEETFRAHCAFLASGRIRLTTAEELRSLPDDADAVAITFDDAFANTYTAAWPILEAYGLHATVFVVSGHVGAHNDWGGRRAPGIPHLPLMTWRQLGELRQRGATLGAHTHTHPALQGLSTPEVESELAYCAEHLERETGVDARTFAYPYGAHDAVSTACVRERFALACTTALRPLASGDDRALVPRLDMCYFRAPGSLEAWGSFAFRSRIRLRYAGRQLKGWLSAPRTGGRVA